MPIYLFSVLAAPKSIIKKIKNIHRNFLWGWKEGNRKWPLVDWQTICTPKALGGLGLRDPLDKNKVMSAKIWWRWVNYEDELWAKLWHPKYEPQWPQHSLVRFKENLPGSSIWKIAQENRGLVQKHSFWEVRNGQHARFASEALNQEPTISCGEDTPLLRTFLQNNSLEKVAEFWDNGNEDQMFKRWKERSWWQDKASGEDIK